MTTDLADVLPDSYGTPAWQATVEHLLDLGRKRRPENPEAWANEWLRAERDQGDLRALGYCRQCHQPITLRQVGRCIYSEPCGHYRAQGELKRVAPYIVKRQARLTPARRTSLLKLIGVQDG